MPFFKNKKKENILNPPGDFEWLLNKIKYAMDVLGFSFAYSLEMNDKFIARQLI